MLSGNGHHTLPGERRAKVGESAKTSKQIFLFLCSVKTKTKPLCTGKKI